MKKTIMTLGLMLVLTGIIFGCSSKASQLTGKWSGVIPENNGESSAVTAEFFSDNTLNLTMGGVPLSSKWTILDDGRIKVDLINGGPTILGTLQNHSLILDFSGISSGIDKITLKKL